MIVPPLTVPPGTGGLVLKDNRHEHGVVLSDGEAGLWVELADGDDLVDRSLFLPDQVVGDAAPQAILAAFPDRACELQKAERWDQAAAHWRGRDDLQLVSLLNSMVVHEQRIQAHFEDELARVRRLLGDSASPTHEERVRRWRIVWREWPLFAGPPGAEPSARGQKLAADARRAHAAWKKNNALIVEVEPVATNATLEAAIDQNPDDRHAYQVYGDWLQSQGDPRGELIALMCSPSTPAVDAEIRRFVEAHETELLGSLPNHPTTVRFDWRWGFLEAAHLRRYAAEGVDRPRLLKHMLELPVSRFLRCVTLVTYSGQECPVLLSHRLPTLRRFYLDALGDCGLPDLFEAVPALEELVVRARGVQFRPIVSERLTSLRLDVMRLRIPRLSDIHLPNLQRLEVTPGARQLLALDRAQLPALRTLALRHPKLVSDLDVVGLLAGSTLLAQAEELQVWACEMSEASARAIYSSADRFAHLRRIVVPSNLHASTIDRLRLLGPEVLVR